MLKMAAKKVIIWITEILALIMGGISAVGGSCPAFNVDAIGDHEGILYTVMSSNLLIFQISNILTYVGAIGTLVALVGLGMKKKWFWTVALCSAVLGAITGLIPYLLIAAAGGFTPSIMRVVTYAIVIILLLIPGFKRELKDNIEVVKGSESTNLAAILFVPGLFMWIQSVLVAPSHAVFDHANHGTAIQIGVGIVMMAMGVLAFAIAKLTHNDK